MAEVDKMVRSVSRSKELEGNYDLLHKALGGVRMLIGVSFTILETPQERHIMAKYIYSKELKIHDSKHEALKCLRRKGWSQKQTFELLDHVEETNCLKKAKHQVSPSLDIILNNLLTPRKSNVFLYIKNCFLIQCPTRSLQIIQINIG